MTYSYTGDSVTADHPTGGTDITTVADVFGRTVQLKQYTQGSTPTGAADTSSFKYDRLGQLIEVKDSASPVNTWKYTYDLQGRKVKTEDPDAGTMTTHYDPLGRADYTINGNDDKTITTYDDFGRITATYKDTQTAANQLTAYTYDPVGALGQLASATRYTAGSTGPAYIQRTAQFDDAYRPKKTETVIPAGTTPAEAALAGTYVTTATYRNNGAPATTVFPSLSAQPTQPLGGLPAETLTYGYNTLGQQASVTGSSGQAYVADTAYEFDGLLHQQILGNSGSPSKQVRHTLDYVPGTRRLATSLVETAHQTNPGTWTSRTTDDYTYDLAGNVASIAGKSGTTADLEECFGYDNLRRMTAAWTQSSGNCTTPQKTGAAAYAYWTNWNFGATTGNPAGSSGNRSTQTSYNAAGTPTSTSTYDYTLPGIGGPHAVDTVTTNGTTATYTYDKAGNTLTRPGQTLKWNTEGRLERLTTTAGQTNYIYNADGTRLLRTDPDGTATLTLPDGTELSATTTPTTITGTRYIAGVAVRTGATTLAWNIADHHGTGQVTIDPAYLTATRRRSTPYGEPNPTGTPVPGFGTKGFAGGTTDPTGLTHLGAREYDPTIGRFLSVDPAFVSEDPQSWNGYTYANNTPVTLSDPTGLAPVGCFNTNGCSWVRTASIQPKRSAAHDILGGFAWLPIIGDFAMYGDALLYEAEGNQAAADELYDTLAVIANLTVLGAVVPPSGLKFGRRLWTLAIEKAGVMEIHAGVELATKFAEKKVPYGSTELSKLAIQYRLDNPSVKYGQNVAVFVVNGPGGQRVIISPNVPKGPHSEYLIDQYMKGLTLPKGKSLEVVAVYSEWVPCKGDCMAMVEAYGSAVVSWSFKDGQSARTPIREMIERLRSRNRPTDL
ncbi:RHS repeat-associated protein [Allocatelliglobosispora scoriae]|uniref:RHS repeat-associated protein n=1 Tax=Allocatelliglobosispora scoriae TaxID=643052 RepID=A0A841C415_9ACTN|nr:RHS repeat-associated core domain-containing protein [Allocatelliglobosispora scoriae]MBB5874625.1 RHS repeat-associated protein [Allocatelliglobosispora scoriae]